VVDEVVAARGTELASEDVKSVEGVSTFLTASTSIVSVAERAPLASWSLSPFELPDGELESSALGGLNGGDGSIGLLD
jgi:hypothetical protein